MDYTQYDYASMVEELTQRLSETEGWTSTYQTETGQRLIQLFADATDTLAFMLERRSQEAFIDTALLKRSVIAHASEMGYRIRRAISMTGKLQLNLFDTQADPMLAEATIIIPKYTMVKSIITNKEFVTTEEVKILSGSSSAELPVKEGRFVELEINTGSEEFNETLDVLIEDYESIDEYSLEIEDIDTKFYDVESSDYNFGTLGYASATDPVYDIRYGTDGMRIVFGNDIFGKKPRGTLKVRYVVSKNVSTPFTKLGNEFLLPGQYLYDVSNTTPPTQYGYVLTNEEIIRGYLPVEDTGTIIENAKESLRSNNRAVIGMDFEHFGSRAGIGGIVDVKAYGEAETNSLIFNMNNVYMSYATEDGVDLTTEQKNDFDDFMKRYKLITTHAVIGYANRVYIKCNAQIRKNQKLPLTNAQAYLLVVERFNEFFRIKKGSIGKDLQHSDLVAYMNDLTTTINGVKYNVIDFMKIELEPLYNIGRDVPMYSTRVTIEDDYDVTDGDSWTLTVNGTDHTISVVDGDTPYMILDRMRETIATYGGDVVTQMDNVGGVNSIRLISRFVDDYLTVTTPSSDLDLYTVIENGFFVPSATLNMNGIDDVVTPGSVEVLDSVLDPVFTDDSLGKLQPVSGSGAIPKINYKNFSITGLYLTDVGSDYFIRYKQNEFQNVSVDSRTVLVLSPFADSLTDMPRYSTIFFV